jgi:hypothetical protein
MFSILCLWRLEAPVVADRRFPVRPGRNAGCYAAFGERMAEPISVVAFVTEQFPGARQRIDHQGRAFVIAHLAFAQQHDQRSSAAIADSMQL